MASSVYETPFSYSVTMNGPAPRGTPSASTSSSGTIEFSGLASTFGSAVCGSLRVSTTVVSSGVSIDATFAKDVWSAAPFSGTARYSNVRLTSAEVSGSPFENSRPSRSMNE